MTADARPSARPTRVTLAGHAAGWVSLSPVFQDLPGDVTAMLAAVAIEQRLAAGDRLFAAGDPADAVWIVAQGELGIGPADSPSARYRPGDLVGDAALTGDELRTATVLARTAAVVVRLERRVLEAAWADVPDAHALVQARLRQRRASRHLVELPLFAGVPAAQLEALDDDAAFMAVPAGSALVTQGEPADTMFLVLHGTFEATVSDGRTTRVVGTMTRGDTIGELAVLTEEPRAATVRARRDGAVLRLSRDQVSRLMHEHPTVGVGIAKALAHRLRASNRARPRPPRPHCVGILQHAAADPAFVAALASALSRPGESVLVIDAARAREAGVDPEAGGEAIDAQVASWLTAQEVAHRFLLLIGGPDDDAWTRCCVRQSEHVLVLAPADADPAPGTAERQLQALGAEGPTVELVLHHAGATPSRTSRWLDARQVRGHHHVCGPVGPGTPGADDIARLARFLRGEAIGLALSGGAARGFSHIGTLRAIRALGIPVDVIAGTSMGGVVGMLHTLGRTPDEQIAACLAAFPEADVVRDFTLPIVALMKGKSTVDMFQTMYAGGQLEDGRIRVHVVSTSLAAGDIVVHTRGPCWLWARATTSVPGIGPPVVLDGDLLVDGGVVDNLPIATLHAAGAGVAVAVDVSAAPGLHTTLGDQAWLSGTALAWRRLLGAREAMPSVLHILTRTSTMASTRRAATAADLVDLYLKPPVQDIPTMAWRSVPHAAALGDDYARPLIAAWAETMPTVQAARRAPPGTG